MSRYARWCTRLSGEQTLRDLVAEARATESRRRAQVRTVLTGSYSHYYRQMLPRLLESMEFRCNNTARLRGDLAAAAGHHDAAAAASRPPGVALRTCRCR